ELQLVNSFRRLDVRVELLPSPAAARPVRPSDEAPHSPLNRAARRGRRGDGAEGAERAGTMVFHERPDFRPVVSSTGLRVVRPESQPYRLDHCVLCLAGAAFGWRRAAAQPAAFYPVPGNLRRTAAR